MGQKQGINFVLGLLLSVEIEMMIFCILLCLFLLLLLYLDMLLVLLFEWIGLIMLLLIALGSIYIS